MIEEKTVPDHAVDVRVRVRYAETDQMGIAYYANYFVWFEVGRSEYCRRRGFEYRRFEKEYGLYLVVTEAACRYRLPARYDDELIVRTWVSEIRRRSLTFSYDIRRAADDQTLARGYTVHIVMDGQGRPRSLPPDCAAALGGPVANSSPP
jgi:acyl-CoA thioester hydrolase